MSEEMKSPETEVHPMEYVDVVPTADIIEEKNGVRVVVDLPGVDASNLDIDIKDRMMKVSGTSTMSRNNRAVKFCRSFQLSDQIDINAIKAKISDGVLTISLPKSESAKVHKISVTGE